MLNNHSLSFRLWRAGSYLVFPPYGSGAGFLMCSRVVSRSAACSSTCRVKASHTQKPSIGSRAISSSAGRLGESFWLRRCNPSVNTRVADSQADRGRLTTTANRASVDGLVCDKNRDWEGTLTIPTKHVAARPVLRWGVIVLVCAAVLALVPVPGGAIGITTTPAVPCGYRTRLRLGTTPFIFRRKVA